MNIFVVLITCQILLSPVFGDLDPDDIARIDEFAETVLQCQNVPGMTLSVVHQGEAVLTKGYGIANLETNETVTESHMFVIASVTKSMSSALLAKLIDENPDVDWDTSVRSLIGDDFFFSDGYRSNVSSIRDLVAHKMAVPLHEMIWEFDQWSTEELVERIRFFDHDAPFRTGDFYNNLMYGIAGYVTEILGNGHWKDLMKTHLFDPLGMTETHIIDETITDHSAYAVSYADRFGVRFPVPFELFNAGRSVGAMGMVVSNAVDMAKWLKFMLANGKNEEGQQIISEEALAAVFTPEMALDRAAVVQKPKDPVTMTSHETYAKGWRNGYYNGYVMASHGGYFPEYSSEQSIYPDLDIGIFTSYTGPKDFDNLLQHAFIVDLIMDQEPWLQPEDLCPTIMKKDKLVSKYEWQDDDYLAEKEGMNSGINSENYNMAMSVEVSRELIEYAGDYGNFGYGNLTVFVENDELFFYYGRMGYFQLIPTQTQDYFLTLGRNTVSLIREIDYIQFYSTDGQTVDQLVVGRPEAPLFILNLSLSDAPPPPNPNCG